MSFQVSPYLFAFGPDPLVTSLIALSDTAHLIHPVGVDLNDEDSILYTTLLTRLEEETRGDREAEILIICPLLGDRFCTISLSIPLDHIYVISGANVELLLALKGQTQLSTIAAQRAKNVHKRETTSLSSEAEKEAPTSVKDSQVSNDDLLVPTIDIESLADKITVQARRGVMMLNHYMRDENDESNIDASVLETDLSSLL